MNKRPTDILEDKHCVILKVVGTMSVLAESLEMGAGVVPDVLRDIAEFMGVFADKSVLTSRPAVVLMPPPTAVPFGPPDPPRPVCRGSPGN